MLPDASRPAEFPRSANYDPDWVLDNMMGPHALWLTESLAESMELSPPMRVLDLGCGRALSSIFLAKEFDVQVWATDLWIDASENCRRICGADAAAADPTPGQLELRSPKVPPRGASP
ncbi:MAG: hypothetical protein OXM54_15675 [Acidimicrobiaceae bacterium]|nr:hypothetical protein [Acidimicrobiaceae bacterium]